MSRTAWIMFASVVALAAIAASYWLGTRSARLASHEDVKATAAAADQGAKTERKVRFYRNPMGLADTSPVPKKDPMGMDYIAVYEGDSSEPAMPAGTVKISP